jgi:signal transduction histidine kinase
MIFVNVLLSITTFIALALGLLIIISNPHKRENQGLFAFVMSLALWLFINLLTNLSPTPELALFFASATLVAAVLAPYMFSIFVEFYLDRKVTVKKLLLWAILPLILIGLAPTRLNIVSIDAYGLNTVTGPAYFLLIVELLVYFGQAIRKLYKKYKAPQTSVLQKAQLRYIFAGFITAFVPIFSLNVIAPIVGAGDVAILFGPNAVIFLALFTSIAIIKHRLLDIRLLVARSIAYIFSLGTVVIIYSLIVFGIFSSFLGTGNLAIWQQYLYVILALFLAFTYQPMKKFFDRNTNRLFYRDAYDPQQLLDELNKTLVSTIDLNSLMHQVSEVIGTTLKAEFCLLTLGGGVNREKLERVVGTVPASQLNRQDISNVTDFLAHVRQKLVITDELTDKYAELKERLTYNNIATVVHMQSSTKTGTGLGYLMLGPKKSGNPYSSQDTKLLEIIADELVIAVQNALRFEEIQNFAKTLQDKVDEATRKLRITNEKLRQLDQTKDDFISMASHQLRTPLTSVKGYVSMVLDEDAGKVTPQQRKLLDQAFISSQRMVYLIADLLNVSRLKTGKFVIDAKPTNLADVVETELEQLKETAKGRGLKMEYKHPKNFPIMNLDETKIRQVIMNFSDNAIYYTPAGGTITVSVEDKPSSVELTVADNGIGVPKAMQHHLFTKFYRAENAKKARPDGTGLGLFMAQKVIVAQGGSIIFHSEENKGSTFGFSFPKAKLLVK